MLAICHNFMLLSKKEQFDHFLVVSSWTISGLPQDACTPLWLRAYLSFTKLVTGKWAVGVKQSIKLANSFEKKFAKNLCM